MPIAAGPDRVRSDPNGFSSAVIRELLSKPSFNIGQIDLEREIETEVPTADVGSGYFHTLTPIEFAGSTFFQVPALGICLVNTLPVDALAASLSASPRLDAGAHFNVGAEEINKFDPGNYGTNNIAQFLPPGSSVTVSGTGGKDIGAFTVSVKDPEPFTWTNPSAGSTIEESKGAVVNWTGGTPGTFVSIAGSVTLLNPEMDATFQCVAPIEQGSFTIGANVLLQLPTNSTNAPG